MKPIYVLNGPNLNRLGKREPEIYGKTTLADVEAIAAKRPAIIRSNSGNPTAKDRSSTGSMRRSTAQPGIIINPAAFTFTSLAILDALKMFEGPIIELHITNIHRRESVLPPLVCFEGRDGGHRRPWCGGLPHSHELDVGITR